MNLHERVRRRLIAGANRLRTNVWAVVQTALAASISYFLAVVVLGQEQPFFAPIAAVISLGLTLGERGRRTVEVVLGVAVGLLVADLIVLATHGRTGVKRLLIGNVAEKVVRYAPCPVLTVKPRRTGRKGKAGGAK